MKPERAREIALTCFIDGKELGFVSVAVIADRILKACAEQREVDAKKCDAYCDHRRAMQKKTAESYYEGAADAADELAQAIRRQD